MLITIGKYLKKAVENMTIAINDTVADLKKIKMPENPIIKKILILNRFNFL